MCLPMREATVCDRSWPIKIAQYAINIVFVWSGEFSSLTNSVLSTLGFGSSSGILSIPTLTINEIT